MRRRNKEKRVSSNKVVWEEVRMDKDSDRFVDGGILSEMTYHRMMKRSSAQMDLDI